MREGFDVGMEMSGQPAALRDMLANMNHGGKIAMLGLPADEIAIDWGTVVLNMLTIKGIYGREMFETWYSMSVMLERGLDLGPVITHRFGYADFEQAFDVARHGQCGKVILDWTHGNPARRSTDVRPDARRPGDHDRRDPRRRAVQVRAGDHLAAERRHLRCRRQAKC